MSTQAHFPRGTAAASVLVGTLAGGAAGLLLAETVTAFLVFLVGEDPEASGPLVPTALFLTMPVVCAAVGALMGSRRARGGRSA
ncbi:hypothetical protein [Streptomyces sp. NPDC004726]